MNQKILLQALRGKETIRPPCWLMRQAGRHLSEYRELRRKARNFLDFCYTPDLAVEATLQPLRRYGVDGAILFADILVIPDALGQDVVFVEGRGPVLEPVRSIERIPGFDENKLHDHLAPIYETVSRLTREVPDGTTLIGFAGAPWTVATYMVEGEGSRDHMAARRWAVEDPDGFSLLINVLVSSTVAYLQKQIESGVEAVQLFDSWAGVLGDYQFRKWVIEPTREIVRRLKSEYPDIPIIGFPRGAGLMYESYVTETGVDAVGLDNTVPLEWAAEVLQRKCTVQGNLDNLILQIGGRGLETEARRILQTLSGGPFIFNLGHGVLPDTSPDDVLRLVELVKNWRND